MAANMPCPRCRRLLEVPEEFQGREVRCPECQAVFVGGPATDITATSPKPLEPAGSAAVYSGPPPAAAPQAISQEPRRPAFADLDQDSSYLALSRRAFKPGGTLVLSVKILLALNVLIGLVLLGSDYLQYDLMTRVHAGANVPLEELERNDDRQMVLGVVHFLLNVATVIVFVIWFHRAHANLTSLGARDLRYTSGWAAGCWFVPIMNLYRPVQIAQEIWRHCAPSTLDEDGFQDTKARNSVLIGLWWAIWIAANVIGNFALQALLDASTPEALQAATVADMIAEVVAILAALLAIAVVSSIDARQTVRAEEFGAGQLPPDDEELEGRPV